MNETDLNRVRQDLDTLQQAIGFDRPFSRDDVVGNLWLAACSALLVVWGLLGASLVRWTVLIPLAVTTVLIAAMFSLRAHRGRVKRASRWREHRAGLTAAVIATPLVVA